MSVSASAKNIPNIFLVRNFSAVAGILVACFGLLDIVSWYAHWRFILQMLPNTAPMQFNTALCFIASGTGLFLLATARAPIARWLCALTTGFTLLTLLEYLIGRSFGIDELFYKPYFLQIDTTYQGRMSPLAAVCFIFINTGICWASFNKKWSQRLTAAGMTGSIVIVIAVIALSGFLFGIQSAYGWGAYSRMALNTAIIFLILGSGLLMWAWQTARQENFNFLRWLPITASVTLMAMVAFVSAVNMAELKTASFWRKHTIDVILQGQVFQDTLIDLQRGTRGYVTMGDTNALASYKNSLALEPQLFDRLVKLTHDNPTQQARLKDLAKAMKEVFSYDRRTIALYNAQGFPAVSKTDANGESRKVFGNAHEILQKFSLEEQKLLDQRGASEQADYDNATRLLVVGSALAALLLVLANKMASRELLHRKRIELRLREITTLQEAILGSANYAIISLDPKGMVKTFNPAAERMLGYSVFEVVGKTTPMLWHDPVEVAAQAEKMSRELGRPIPPGIEIITSKALHGKAEEYEATYVHKNGMHFPVLISLTALADETGVITGFLGVIADITERKRNETEREKLIYELQQALVEVKTLSGLIPICGWCKSVRSDKGFWQTVEQYVGAHSDVTFTHGICPNCIEKMKADALKTGVLKITEEVASN
jgi:PAS domain S-box-containing protein